MAAPLGEGPPPALETTVQGVSRVESSTVVKVTPRRFLPPRHVRTPLTETTTTSGVLRPLGLTSRPSTQDPEDETLEGVVQSLGQTPQNRPVKRDLSDSKTSGPDTPSFPCTDDHPTRSVERFPCLECHLFW